MQWKMNIEPILVNGFICENKVWKDDINLFLLCNETATFKILLPEEALSHHQPRAMQTKTLECCCKYQVLVVYLEELLYLLI